MYIRYTVVENLSGCRSSLDKQDRSVSVHNTFNVYWIYSGRESVRLSIFTGQTGQERNVSVHNTFNVY